MARFKAIIRGAYGEGNFGDDVLMIACHGLLRRAYEPEEIAFVFVSQPSEAERAYVERLLPGINLVRFESDAAAELVVWGGGTQFYSFARTRAIVPFYRKVLTALLDPRKAYNYVVKKIFGGKFNAGQRFAALGVGVGPFVPGSVEETYTRNVFSRMDFVAVRDTASMALCREWQIERALLRSDLCFLPGVWWPENIPAAPVRRGRNIGVVVRDWPHDAGGAAYDQPLLRAVGALRQAGCTVTFILFRAGGDGGWERLLEEHREAVTVWNPESQTIADFLGILNGFDCLLTARFHGALFGALLGKPIVCIEIEPKLRLVSELLNCGLWRQPFDQAECLALLEDVFQNFESRQAAIQSAVAGQQASAARLMREFLDFTRGAAPEPVVREDALVS